MTCVFCEIAKENPPGKIASETVFLSTEHVLGFMDILPLMSSQVHALVIPRKHYGTVDTMHLHDAGEVGKALTIVSRAIARVTGTRKGEALAFNIIQNNGARAGQVVHHVHFHIVLRQPKYRLPSSDRVIDLQRHFFAREERTDLDDDRAVIALEIRKAIEEHQKL